MRPSAPLPLNFVLAILFCFVSALTVMGQSNTPVPDARGMVVLTDSLASQLVRFYVDRDAAMKMSAALKKHQKEGRYKHISDAHVLAGRLTADLLAVHKDEHLHVDFNPALAYELSGNVEDVPGMVAGKLQRERARNFGFRKAEVLSGNIGYLELSGFSRLNKYSRATADAAFHLLENTSALIIDLRYGSGGSPEMMTYILSHFYKNKLHVSDIFIRSENTTISYHTTPDSTFTALHAIPLYVLTSYKTFSAAEGLAFTLQRTRRAKIVGEKTRGGAHTVAYRPLSSGFICDIPFGKAKDPSSGSNWEGTGVTPDIAVTESDALEAAEKEIFAQALRNSSDSAEKRQLRLQRDLVLSRYHPAQADSSALKKLSGVFGAYCIFYKEGCLYYQKTGMARFPLLPLSATAMRTKGNDEFIVEFYKDTVGNISRIATVYSDGRVEYAERNP